jgi:hypothetical protein
MKSIIISLLTATMFLLLITGCDYDKESQQKPGINGQVTGQSGCKSHKSGNGTTTVSDSLSCVDYSFDSTNNKLYLKHYNTAFNCCPGNLSCIVSVQNDTIIIQETEQYIMCDCDCLYDLDIAVYNVENQTYILRFIEPYTGTMEPLIFTIDLPETASGSYCVSRTQYPWGL